MLNRFTTLHKRNMAVNLPKRRSPNFSTKQPTPTTTTIFSTGDKGEKNGGSGYKKATQYTMNWRIPFIGVVGIGGFGVYYFTHLDKVPISGRTRMIGITPEDEIELGQMTWEQIKQEYAGKFLSSYNPTVKQVKRVAGPIIEASGLNNLKWEIVVIQDPNVNAFVIPGGKICVFTGLFDVVQNDDMLAAVLAHEIGHVVARHGAEGMTWGRVLMIGASLLTMLFDLNSSFIPNMILQYFVQLPKSRKMESEADHIGLLLMSKACFDPNGAAAVWKNFAKLDADKGRDHALMPYISTHPSSNQRIDDINGWMNEANAARELSSCGALSRWKK